MIDQSDIVSQILKYLKKEMGKDQDIPAEDIADFTSVVLQIILDRNEDQGLEAGEGIKFVLILKKRSTGTSSKITDIPSEEFANFTSVVLQTIIQRGREAVFKWGEGIMTVDQ